MPSRASTSFLHFNHIGPVTNNDFVSMPSRASTSFLRKSVNLIIHMKVVSMPSRASTSFLRHRSGNRAGGRIKKVSMPSRAGTSFLRRCKRNRRRKEISVSMPSRAVTSFLQNRGEPVGEQASTCQCPLGLLPHFY